MTPVRLAAARALVRLEQRRGTLASEVERARAALDDPRDRALLLELVSGVERRRLALDTVIAQAARRAVDSLDPPVRAALRLGAYQLLYLDRIPAHAVVHESVETARAIGAARAAGFVNAVLRRLQRTPASAALPPLPGPTDSRDRQVAYLSRTLSHPDWLVKRWLERMPLEEVDAWCRFNDAPPEPTVVPSRGAETMRAVAGAGVQADPARFVRGAWRLPAGALSRLPETLRAELRVQDEGSLLVALALGVAPGQRVLDACASPGGKTIALAGELHDQGLLVAGDLRAARVALLVDRLRRAGLQTPVVRFDATKPFPFGAAFDRLLVDAPCSGLGTLSRDPDVKWSRQPDDLPRLASIQLAMLQRAADAVAPGGRLVYATCSSEPEENEDVVARFMASRPEFALVPIDFGDRVNEPEALLDSGGRLVTSPARHGIDAFFAALLARSEAA